LRLWRGTRPYGGNEHPPPKNRISEHGDSQLGETTSQHRQTAMPEKGKTRKRIGEES
jgi:hypothetical protein